MKIGILGDCLSDEPVYGVSVYTHNLLSELPRDGSRITIAYSAAPPRFSYVGVRARRLWHCAVPWSPQRFRDRLFKSLISGYDIFHDPANYSLPPGKIPCKTVITVHDVGALEYPEFFREFTVERFRTRLPLILRDVDAVITTTELQKQKILKWFPIAPEKVHVVPHGVDPKVFHRCEGAGPFLGPYILSVSAPQPRKGHISLLRAFNLLKDSIPHQLCLVGDADNWAIGPILEEIRRLGLSDRVKLCGRVANKDLPPYYSFADVMILPSLNEAFAMPAIEAMMCGCPVILSRLESLTTLYGDAVLYVEPGDAGAIVEGLRRVIGDHGLRRDLVEKGYEFARTFTATRMAEQTLAVYRKVLET